MLIAVCALTVGAGAYSARAALEAQNLTGAPRWLHLFGVTIRPDGAMLAV
jgi:hypothetical protein